jgi:hypothetical protein
MTTTARREVTYAPPASSGDEKRAATATLGKVGKRVGLRLFHGRTAIDPNHPTTVTIPVLPSDPTRSLGVKIMDVQKNQQNHELAVLLIKKPGMSLAFTANGQFVLNREGNWGNATYATPTLLSNQILQLHVTLAEIDEATKKLARYLSLPGRLRHF